MARIVLAAIFALLLVGMQREMVVHQVDHLRAALQHGDHATLQKSASGHCEVCALLASGANGVPAPSEAQIRAPNYPRQPAQAAEVPGPNAPFAFYLSRAPPSVL